MKLVEVKGHNSETFCLLIDHIGRRFITVNYLTI